MSCGVLLLYLADKIPFDQVGARLTVRFPQLRRGAFPGHPQTGLQGCSDQTTSPANACQPNPANQEPPGTLGARLTNREPFGFVGDA